LYVRVICSGQVLPFDTSLKKMMVTVPQLSVAVQDSGLGAGTLEEH